MKLYEIANDYLVLLEAIEAGDIPEECIEDTLEAVKSTLEEKADNIACVLKTLSAEIQAFKTEEARLAERRRVKENAYNRLRDYLSSTLLRANVDEVETARNRISFRKSEAVEITDEEAYFKWTGTRVGAFITYEPKANKAVIKRAIQEGTEIPGVELRINQNIQIN